MARCSGIPQSILIERFTSQDIIEIMANEELKLTEDNIYDRYYNGIMNQIIRANSGKDFKYIDYTEAWKIKPQIETPEEAAEKRAMQYKAIAERYKGMGNG